MACLDFSGRYNVSIKFSGEEKRVFTNVAYCEILIDQINENAIGIDP